MNRAETIAAQCLVMRVRRLNREVTRLYDTQARKHDLTSGRINILVAVATTPGVRAHDLVEPLSIEKSTLSRNLARLESAGLVRAETVGRSRRLFLTAAGAQKIDDLYDDWLAVQQAARQLLGELVDPLMAHARPTSPG
ncbi:MAG: MarR family transcriptional regulator [Myxococcota bacterium]